MPVAGVFVRVDQDAVDRVRQELGTLPGADVVDFDGANRLGVVLEARTLKRISDLVQDVIPAFHGVLGVVPVYLNHEDHEQMDGGA